MVDFEPEAYRSAFENIGIPALITDINYEIIDVNRAGLEFIQYEYEEIVGRHVGSITTDLETLESLITTVSEGASWEGDFEVETRDGHTVYGKGSAAPIKVDGDVVGFQAIFLDNTKERQYRNATEVLNRLLRHDVRNQVNVIYGSVQLAKSAANEDAVPEHLEKALDGLRDLINKGERARDLRELLENTYDEANEPIRLGVLLNQVVVDKISEYEDADFQFQSFPEVSVLGDHLLEKVFSLVIDNAIEHNDKTNPSVEIGVDVGEKTVTVSIADNGPGIPEEQHELVLGREEISDTHHGSGVSLYFADNVLKSYNADIYIEDNDPEGAVFNIELQKSP